MNHTPGPWHIVRRSTVCAGDRDEIDNPIRVHVADCYGRRAEANAHLIAAAPDLLAACELAVRNLDPAPYWIGALTAAIAKARGKEAQ